MNLVWMLLVIAAGMGLSFEAGLLGPLGAEVGHLWAALSIFGVGAALLWLIRLFSPGQKTVDWTAIPRWQLSGGLLGPIYVVMLTLATPLIGVTMTMIGVLIGQIGKGFIIDYFGWFGVPRQPASIYRLGALGFVLLALLLTYLGANQ